MNNLHLLVADRVKACRYRG